MTRRFHLFAHRQHVVALARTPGGMDNYIAPFATIGDAKAHLVAVNAELVATKGGTAAYDYAQIAVLSENGALNVVSSYDGQAGNWADKNECGCTGACDGKGPLAGYIVRRPVQDRSRVGFMHEPSAEVAPMGYLLVQDPRPGEEIYHGRFEVRRIGFSASNVEAYDPVGAFTTTRFGE